MTEDQIKHLVDRFLNWKLPENFNPDGGISFEECGNLGTPHQYRREPSGTNLLDASQATAMVRHMLDGMPDASPAATPVLEALDNSQSLLVMLLHLGEEYKAVTIGRCPAGITEAEWNTEGLTALLTEQISENRSAMSPHSRPDRGGAA